MRASIKALAAVLAIAGATTAQAAQWNVSWGTTMQQITHLGGGSYNYGAYQPYTLTGVVEGVLQGDGNTVLVSDIVSWSINGDTMGSADFTSGGVGSVSNYFTNFNWNDDGVLTLDGSLVDLSASNLATDTYIEFMNNRGAGNNAGFAYYGTGSSHEYNGQLSVSAPLTGWSMTPVSSVPEPATALLMLAGVPLLAASRRRRAAQS